MQEATAPLTNELRDAVLKAAQAARRRRAGEDDAAAAAAQAEYDALARRYAEHRITLALGPDPKAIEPEVFRAVLYSLADPAAFAVSVEKAKPSALAHETMTAMLLAPAPVGGLFEALGVRASPRDAFDPHTPLRRLLRGWAEGTAADPLVARALREAAKESERFDRSAAEAESLIGDLKLKCEKRGPGAARLDIGLDGAGRLAVSTAVPWSELVRTASAEAEKIYRAVAEAELAAARLREIASDLNRELARFFAELVPRYLALVRRLAPAKRRELAGFFRANAGRAGALVRAAEATDFTGDEDSTLGVPRKALPRHLHMLTAEAGYARVREALTGGKGEKDRVAEGRKSL